jgi:hypothetical protein
LQHCARLTRIYSSARCRISNSVDSRDIADNPAGSISDYFGQTVSIYQLGIYGLASADVFATHSEDLNDRSYLFTVEKGDSDLNNLMRCISAAYGISLSAENQEKSGGNSTRYCYSVSDGTLARA